MDEDGKRFLRQVVTAVQSGHVELPMQFHLFHPSLSESEPTIDYMEWDTLIGDQAIDRVPGALIKTLVQAGFIRKIIAQNYEINHEKVIAWVQAASIE